MSVSLRTKYLGLDLKNPLVASAGPLTGRIDTLMKLEEAGAAAVVLPSLFEEEIVSEGVEIALLYDSNNEGFAEAQSYLPEMEDYHTGPDTYLRLVRQAKQSLTIPVIGSLNGTSNGGWIHYGRMIEEAGADALELNIYYLRHRPRHDGPPGREPVPRAGFRRPWGSFDSPGREDRARSSARWPTWPRGSSVPGPTAWSCSTGSSSLTSTSRPWPSSRAWCSAAATSCGCPCAGSPSCGRTSSSRSRRQRGVHTPDDVIKLLLAGADVAMTTSALLKHGPGLISDLLVGLRTWLEEKEYVSVEQMKGSMSQRNSPDPAAFERANYVKTIQSYSSKIAW